jgi:hypothetical protein
VAGGRKAGVRQGGGRQADSRRRRNRAGGAGEGGQTEQASAQAERGGSKQACRQSKPAAARSRWLARAPATDLSELVNGGQESVDREGNWLTARGICRWRTGIGRGRCESVEGGWASSVQLQGRRELRGVVFLFDIFFRRNINLRLNNCFLAI